MKFDEIFDKSSGMIEYKGSELIYSQDVHACWNCGKETHWVDIIFEAALCSPACEDAKWKEYAEAT